MCVYARESDVCVCVCMYACVSDVCVCVCVQIGNVQQHENDSWELRAKYNARWKTAGQRSALFLQVTITHAHVMYVQP